MEPITSVQYIKGVGPQRARLFERKGITDLLSLIYFFPIRYEDRRKISKIRFLRFGMKEVVIGEVYKVSLKTFRNRRIFEVIVRDNTGYLSLAWFNFEYAYMVKRFRPGSKILVYGDVRFYSGMPQMIHPDIEEFDIEGDDTLNFGRIVPVYSSIEGIPQRIIRKIMKNALDSYIGNVDDYLPSVVKQRLSLPDLRESIYNLHFPHDNASLEELNTQTSSFHRRIKFDEFFFFEVALAQRKKESLKKDGIVFFNSPDTVKIDYVSMLEKNLPFTLTDDQKYVIKEIFNDLSSGYPMNRLLQGDVGSGKTVVALYSALFAINNGYQVAFMAPTEILAEQHYKTIEALTRNMNLRYALLKSDTKELQRKQILEELADGSLQLIVGTHAIIQPDVRFKNCGLIIIDEQHRFGVKQRMELKNKGNNPHMLIMTATPIPRTLAMTAYGDLDISVIRQMPPNKKPVKTLLFYRANQRQEIYDLLRREMKNKHQVYVVYPLIEESDTLELRAATKMYEELKEVFKEFKVEILHGKVKNDTREHIMNAFRKGEIDMLVATTVIEVGIDVPNATVMLIEHAERFGLSQLHQLRGRVGRGSEQALCILYAHSLTTTAKKRLEAMVRTNDGFKIAEMDLEIRGPGEMLGIKQSGMPDFKMANIVHDIDILKLARDTAFDIVNGNIDIPQEEINKFFKYFYESNKKNISFIGV
ncbi:MAG: ATP-dependent DNA helicase RecG [bacterium]